MLGAESRDSGTVRMGTYGAELGQVPGRQDRRVTLLSGPSRQGVEVPTLQARRLRLSGGAATFPRPHSRTTGSHRGQEKKRSTRQRKTHGQAVRQTKGPSSPRLSELLTSRHLCLGQAPPPSFFLFSLPSSQVSRTPFCPQSVLSQPLTMSWMERGAGGSGGTLMQVSVAGGWDTCWQEALSVFGHPAPQLQAAAGTLPMGPQGLTGLSSRSGSSINSLGDAGPFLNLATRLSHGVILVHVSWGCRGI